ncbi:GntR family transcriptional regulator [Alkaliphilus oremlandii]|uniref:Transcriptional regulator, GntR family n=1 Tax=Alkaliphilus oremlandii (strain OhILAs) TaxID=350688 RepID=A8ML32_ALKOO|nr:GntR family transcriptional regulator [Alkaliphilus oremlandii]ABW17849.1 transcriptional regulator, GntR family [Alkaliphilus oremlandii OhILAs]
MDKLEKLDIENYKPLREIVFEYLRQAILDGRLEPGKRLMEIQMAEQLGVSRTPVREAIRKLELEGLVVMVPRKGAYVADVSIKDVSDVLEVRMVLEGLAASLAAEKMSDDEIKELTAICNDFKLCAQQNDIDGLIQKDVEFHDCIFSATGNSKLNQISQSLREQVYRFRVRYISRYDRAKDLVDEHQAIYEAIVKRDAELAYKCGTKHIENLTNHMMEQLDIYSQEEQ